MVRKSPLTLAERMNTDYETHLSEHYETYAIGRFKWDGDIYGHGVADGGIGCPLCEPERTLYRDQAVCFFEGPAGDIIVQKPAVQSIERNHYGEAVKWKPVPLAGEDTRFFDRVLTPKDSVILYGTATRTPEKQYIDSIINELVNLRATIRLNANLQRTPVIMTGQNKTLQNKTDFQMLWECQPLFLKTTFDQADWGTLDLKVDFKGQDLANLYDWLDALALEHLGIDNNPTMAKRERLVATIEKSNQEELRISNDIRLALRKEQADNVSDMFGIGLTVERNTPPETPAGVSDGPDDENGDTADD